MGAEIKYGQARLLLRQISRRIGEVTETIVSRIEALTESQLEALGDAVFDLHSHEDIEAWLSEHSTENEAA
jgi:predicted deacylase